MGVVLGEGGFVGGELGVQVGYFGGLGLFYAADLLVELADLF